MHDIHIHGEIINSHMAGWFHDVGFYSSLNLKEDLENANGKPIRVYINSIGGDVDEGFLIYTLLRRYAKKNNVEVTTITEGVCASIAVTIFLAGDHRILNKYVSPFVHNAWMYTEGNEKQLIKEAGDLGKVDNMIAEHYANHTELTKEEALLLMDNDTFITPDEALRLKFCTEIETVSRPKNVLHIFNKSNKTEMAKNTRKSGSLMKRAKDILNKYRNVKNKTVYTADNAEIVFPDLEDGQEAKLGDVATIDGVDADGSFVMADGKTFVFEKGELVEIIEREDFDEPETLEEAIEQLEEVEEIIDNLEEVLEEKDDLIEDLTTELEEVKNKIKNMRGASSKNTRKPRENKRGEATKKDAKTRAEEATERLKQNKKK